MAAPTAKDLEWMDEKRCTARVHRYYFSDKLDDQAVAKRVCAGCPVRRACLDYAITNRIELGIWGGMTEKERREERRRRRREEKTDG
jgi:WhiB family redox-sensing transcriptional regulator